MPVFRIENNYTVMSNHNLKNKDISLKVKGLLSVNDIVKLMKMLAVINNKVSKDLLFTIINSGR